MLTPPSARYCLGTAPPNRLPRPAATTRAYTEAMPEFIVGSAVSLSSPPMTLAKSGFADGRREGRILGPSTKTTRALGRQLERSGYGQFCQPSQRTGVTI